MTVSFGAGAGAGARERGASLAQIAPGTGAHDTAQIDDLVSDDRRIHERAVDHGGGAGGRRPRAAGRPGKRNRQRTHHSGRVTPTAFQHTPEGGHR